MTKDKAEKSPRKVPLGRYAHQAMKVTGAPHKTLIKNSFKVLEVEDEDEGGDDAGDIFIGTIEVTDDTEVVKKEEATSSSILRRTSRVGRWVKGMRSQRSPAAGT